jgi:D-aminopeptidase
MLELAKSQNKSLLQVGRDYGTPVVGETADWWLNDIYSSTLSEPHVRHALGIAMNGGQATVLEGQHGGGAGMTCHEFLGGTGTSSRVVNGEADADGKEGAGKEFVKAKYTVGVLCQSNYGHKKDMHIGGIPIGKFLLKEDEEAAKKADKSPDKEGAKPDGGRVSDGSIVIIIMQVRPADRLQNPTN